MALQTHESRRLLFDQRLKQINHEWVRSWFLKMRKLWFAKTENGNLKKLTILILINLIAYSE